MEIGKVEYKQKNCYYNYSLRLNKHSTFVPLHVQLQKKKKKMKLTGYFWNNIYTFFKTAISLSKI